MHVHHRRGQCDGGGDLLGGGRGEAFGDLPEVGLAQDSYKKDSSYGYHFPSYGLESGRCFGFCSRRAFGRSSSTGVDGLCRRELHGRHGGDGKCRSSFGLGPSLCSFGGLFLLASCAGFGCGGDGAFQLRFCRECWWRHNSTWGRCRPRRVWTSLW